MNYSVLLNIVYSLGPSWNPYVEIAILKIISTFWRRIGHETESTFICPVMVTTLSSFLDNLSQLLDVIPGEFFHKQFAVTWQHLGSPFL